jgi:hypothetical protein
LQLGNHKASLGRGKLNKCHDAMRLLWASALCCWRVRKGPSAVFRLVQPVNSFGPADPATLLAAAPSEMAASFQPLLAIEDRFDDIRREKGQAQAQDAGHLGRRDPLALGRFRDGRELPRPSILFHRKARTSASMRALSGLRCCEAPSSICISLRRPRFTMRNVT